SRSAGAAGSNEATPALLAIVWWPTLASCCGPDNKPFLRTARGTIWSAINRPCVRTRQSARTASIDCRGPARLGCRRMPRERKLAEEGTQDAPQRAPGWPRCAASAAVFRGSAVLLVQRGKGALKGL